MIKRPGEYEYVLKNNLCLFTKGPLSQWWGGFKGQSGGFDATLYDMIEYVQSDDAEIFDHFMEIASPILSWNTPIHFNCCEQWMMACKAILMDDVESFIKIMKETHPEQQKALGRQIKNWDEELYKRHRLNIVKFGNLQKFTQNEELKQWLLSSFHPHTIFVEAAHWDRVWGIGLSADDPKAWNTNTWEGLNLLGEAVGYAMKEISKDWER